MQELCGKANNLRRQNVMEANRFYIEKGRQFVKVYHLC
jgi:hypothetical protein